MDTKTAIALDWVERCFGKQQSRDPVMRAIRFLEEAAELAQACGVSPTVARRVIAAVYNRPAGNVAQEVGGTMLTVRTLCAVLSIDADAAFDRELRRVLQKPRSHFAKRNRKKVKLGLHS
jgi:NTP pyrophosphatase (non-canonical NTP hydrolase)